MSLTEQSTTSAQQSTIDLDAVQQAQGDQTPQQQTPDPSASLYQRLGGTYGIAGAVDVLADRLYDNASANRNPYTAAFHAQMGHAGFKYLVTAWSIQECGGPAVYPGRDMRTAHAHLRVSELEFDIVKGEIASTLWHVGVPPREHGEFMGIIESYRSLVVGPAEQWALQPDREESSAQAVDAAAGDAPATR